MREYGFILVQFYLTGKEVQIPLYWKFCNKFIHIFFRAMSSRKKIPMTSEEIEAQIQRRIVEMAESQRNGNYVEAENCRVTIEELKKDYQIKRLSELDQKQKEEARDIARRHEEELESFNKFWDKKMDDYAADGQRSEGEMVHRHQDQVRDNKQTLDKQLPTKIKQSSELLNLRKMEQHMSKQKNFVQAHKVQERCRQLEVEQTENWMNNRNLKIDTAINKLIQKQEHQLQVLQKKIKTGLEEQAKQRRKQEQKLNMKYANFNKELKMQHDKEVIALKGHFKSKGGQSSPQKSRSFIK